MLGFSSPTFMRNVSAKKSVKTPSPLASHAGVSGRSLLFHSSEITMNDRKRLRRLPLLEKNRKSAYRKATVTSALPCLVLWPSDTHAHRCPSRNGCWCRGTKRRNIRKDAMAIALEPNSTYNLLSKDSSSPNRLFVHVKLTDTCLRALEEFQSHQVG